MLYLSNYSFSSFRGLFRKPTRTRSVLKPFIFKDKWGLVQIKSTLDCTAVYSLYLTSRTSNFFHHISCFHPYKRAFQGYNKRTRCNIGILSHDR